MRAHPSSSLLRREFLQVACLSLCAKTLCAKTLRAAWIEEALEPAANVLSTATRSGQVTSAVLYVKQPEREFSRAFGAVESPDAMFLLGSISKPIAMTALLTFYDEQRFRLDDPVVKFLPDFTGDGRDSVTLRHVLTHVSGLPDQLANNETLRRQHAPLSDFVTQAQRTPHEFAPGSRYQYSSMGILLAARVAEVLGEASIAELVEKRVFVPLGMQHSAAGLGRFQLADMVPVQTEKAAPESGAGDPSAKDWDWNSPYWRGLAAPWGGYHASAPDLGRFLANFLSPQGNVLQPETARLMIQNHNRAGLTSRGLGFQVGFTAGCPGCSARTFGHTGSTGTIAWADPETQTICVVLTSLPGRAVQPHPRELASLVVARSVTRL